MFVLYHKLPYFARYYVYKYSDFFEPVIVHLNEKACLYQQAYQYRYICLKLYTPEIWMTNT